MIVIVVCCRHHGSMKGKADRGRMRLPRSIGGKVQVIFGRKANAPRSANDLSFADAVADLDSSSGNVHVFDKYGAVDDVVVGSRR